MKRRVDIAVQQVAVWQAAAQATAKLQAAQQQKAAKATRHSEKVNTLSGRELGDRGGGGLVCL